MNCRDSRPCMETKTFCRCCKTHFYKPEMRGRIRMAICCGGLRMLLYHLHKNCHAPVLYRDFYACRCIFVWTAAGIDAIITKT